jgi:hypothetical protein
MSSIEKTPFWSLGTWRKVGRTLYGVMPFVLAATLLIFSLYFVTYTAESVSLGGFAGNEQLTVHPNQTYTYNISVSYRKLPQYEGMNSTMEDGTLVIEEGLRTSSTLTSWNREWLPIDVMLNGTDGAECLVSATAEGSNGIIRWEGYTAGLSVHTGTTERPEITQNTTVRVHLQNQGSVDALIGLKWTDEYHDYEKPLLYYGIVGLVLALLYPAMFLFKRFLTSRQDKE